MNGKKILGKISLISSILILTFFLSSNHLVLASPGYDKATVFNGPDKGVCVNDDGDDLCGTDYFFAWAGWINEWIFNHYIPWSFGFLDISELPSRNRFVNRHANGSNFPNMSNHGTPALCDGVDLVPDIEVNFPSAGFVGAPEHFVVTRSSYSEDASEVLFYDDIEAGPVYRMIQFNNTAINIGTEDMVSHEAHEDGAHDHPHLENFMNFRLIKKHSDGSEEIISERLKLSFALQDSAAVMNHASQTPIFNSLFPADNGSGICAGCVDGYLVFTTGNYLIIPEDAEGEYIFEYEVNPVHDDGHPFVEECNMQNNLRRWTINIPNKMYDIDNTNNSLMNHILNYINCGGMAGDPNETKDIDISNKAKEDLDQCDLYKKVLKGKLNLDGSPI